MADAVQLLHQTLRLFQRRRDLLHLREGSQRQTGLRRAPQGIGPLVQQTDQHDVKANRLLDAVRDLFEHFGQARALAEHLAQFEDAAHPLGTDAQPLIQPQLLPVAAGIGDRHRRVVGQGQREVHRARTEHAGGGLNR